MVVQCSQCHRWHMDTQVVPVTVGEPDRVWIEHEVLICVECVYAFLSEVLQESIQNV